MQNFGRIEFCERSATGSAMIVVPLLTPAGIALEVQRLTGQVASAVDPPLVGIAVVGFIAGGHAEPISS
jgi:hypothetical protein